MDVIFECRAGHTKIGETIKVVGNVRELGNWCCENAVPLSTSAQIFPLWRSGIVRMHSLSSASSGQPQSFELKFITVSESHPTAAPHWENTPNRSIDLRRLSGLPSSGSPLLISAIFNDGRTSVIKEGGDDASSAGGGGGGSSLVERRQGTTAPSAASSLTSQSGNKGANGPSSVTLDLRGIESPFLRSFLSESRSASSYLQKLQLVERHLLKLTQQPDSVANSNSFGGRELLGSDIIELMAATAIYLTFIQTGQIPCREDGGHHRPNHHAGSANRIFKILLQILRRSESASSTPKVGAELVLVLLRKITVRLPSFDSSFTCGEPLTRIRDIAHRNDIPRELKEEIKRTIQNKLHRCAGPEDLVASERMLERLLSDRRRYNHQFIDQFEIFVRELREFFNSRSLEEELQGLRRIPTLGPHLPRAIDEFIKEKLLFDSSQHNLQPSVFLGMLRASSNLRAALKELRDKSEEIDAANAQRVWLADTAADQFAFVVLTRLATALTEGLRWTDPRFDLGLPIAGGSKEPQRREAQEAWREALAALREGLAQLRYNGFGDEECRAIMKTLDLVVKAFTIIMGNAGGIANSSFRSLREVVLLAKSSLERAVRLTERYAETAASLYIPTLRQMGAALGLPSHSVDVFAEADVRAHIVFPISRLGSALLSQSCSVLGESGVEVVVESRRGDPVVGQLIQINDLSELANLRTPGPTGIILQLRTATGDEELTGIRAIHGVEGIILMHGIPHLSHLSIRARQERLPFAAVVHTAGPLAGKLSQMAGSIVEFACGVDGVVDVTKARADVIRNSTATKNKTNASERRRVGSPPSVDIAPLSPSDPLPALNDVTEISKSHDRVGSKAAMCATMSAMSATSGVPAFEAPRCWVLPFGSMEATLESAGCLEAYRVLLNKMDERGVDSIGSDEADDNLICQVTALLQESLQLGPSNLSHLIAAIQDTSTTAQRYIVRSSANVEDTPEVSAAGLYESIGNVNPFVDFKRFAQAIKSVWASLHSKRAIISRRVLGIPQEKARMAVLVQELFDPLLCFVLHTHNPFTQSSLLPNNATKENWMYAELALGLGEILASGSQRGLPHRVIINKVTGEYEVLNFASYSAYFQACQLAPARKKAALIEKGSGGAVVKDGTTHSKVGFAKGDETSELDDESRPIGPTDFLEIRTADYTEDNFSASREFRDLLCQRLSDLGRWLEESLGSAQDVEGCVLEATPSKAMNPARPSPTWGVVKLGVVQSRPQMGL